MAFMPPPSFAMDATAGSGGPSTFLPEIVTGSPEAIIAHVTQMLKQASTFVQLIEQFEQAGTQLEQAWSGKASESASKKITDTLTAFKSIVDTIQQGAQLLQTSSTLVQTAQTAYQSVVASVNPTVASLMSNPWTYSAAVALSTSTSSALRGFIEAIGGVLKALGAGQLAQTVMSVAQIIGQIEQLFGSGSQAGSTPGSTSGSTPTNSTVASTPVTAPAAPQTVASSTGQQALGAAGGTGTSATGYDAAATQSTDAASAAAAQQNAAAAAQQAAAHQAALTNQGLSNVDPGFGAGSNTPAGAVPTAAGVTPTATGSVPTALAVGMPTTPAAGATPTQVPTADGGATVADSNYGTTWGAAGAGSLPPTGTVGTPAGAGGVPTINAPGSGWIATDPGANYGSGAYGSSPTTAYTDPGVYADGGGAAYGAPTGLDAGATGAVGNGAGDVSIDLDSSGHITSLDAPAGHDYDITISTTVDGVTTSQHAVIDDGAAGSS